MEPGELCRDWAISIELAEPLARVLNQMTEETGLTWSVISGYRNKAEQDELRRQGRPAAPDDVSTHRTCPATGADVTVASFPTLAMKAHFGRVATEHGLRWGGGGPVDSETGIPVDWNHVDTGPRRDPPPDR